MRKKWYRDVKNYIWLALALISLFPIIFFSIPYEEVKNIWIPQEASIVNLVDGNFVNISEVSLSGTAVFVPLQGYESGLAANPKAENSVIILDSGRRVYYLTKIDRKTYVAKMSFYSLSFWVEGSIRSFSHKEGERFAEAKIYHSTRVEAMSGGIAFWIICNLVVLSVRRDWWEGL